MLRKKSLRQLRPHTQHVARLLNEAESAINRLQNCLTILNSHEIADRILLSPNYSKIPHQHRLIADLPDDTQDPSLDLTE